MRAANGLHGNPHSFREDPATVALIPQFFMQNIDNLTAQGVNCVLRFFFIHGLFSFVGVMVF
ncbi:hypothetical protein ACFJ52_004786, partial [Salmonella enterica]